MTDSLACLGTHCAYKPCRGKLDGDEGVGVVHKGVVVWVHPRCARQIAQGKKKKARKKARVGL